MEMHELSPEDEKNAEILANAIGKLIESGVEPLDAAGPIVRALVEVDKIEQTPETAYQPLDYSPPAVQTVQISDDMLKQPTLGLF